MDIKLDNSVSSAMIKGETYNVLSYEEFNKSQALWDIGNIAVVDEINGETYVLPYRGKYEDGKSSQPGIYSAGPLNFEITPNEREEANYKNIPIVTISSNDDIQTILEKENVLSKLAEPWITNPDNITQINIKENDEPGMKCLKSAINSKHCDIDRYNQRFGQNFPNDKRQLKNSSVTLKIIDRYCDNLDMEAILTIRDKEPGVPNPMKHPISISLTTGEFLNMDFDEDIDNEESSDEGDFYDS
jgi:hypothetical protein